MLGTPSRRRPGWVVVTVAASAATIGLGAATIAAATTVPPSDPPSTMAPDAEPATASSDAGAVQTGSAPAGGPAEVAVTLGDFTIDVPATVPAGPVRFTATNTGAEEHQMALVRLAEGETVDDVLAAVGADPVAAFEDLAFVGGPQGVAPGGTQAMEVDLPAGRYAALCFIPSPDGVPHVMKGMVTELEAVTAELPEPVAEIALGEYQFVVPDDLPATGPVRVINNGAITHELAIYRVADGHTFDEAKGFFLDRASAEGPPPVTAAGGVTPIKPGTSVLVDLDLQPGTYVFICFLPTADGSDHLHEGMVAEVQIA